MPLSQSSQKSNWSSLSEVPQIEQYLHSIHCQRYFRTEMIIFLVNCKQVGWPERPQSEQETSSSGALLFLFKRASPKQKSQYKEGAALGLSLWCCAYGWDLGRELFDCDVEDEDNSSSRCLLSICPLHIRVCIGIGSSKFIGWLKFMCAEDITCEGGCLKKSKEVKSDKQYVLK